MKRLFLSLLTFVMLCCCNAFATNEKDKVSFAYDVDFQMNFDNREFYRSKFSSSMTIFGARLTPAVGLNVRQKGGMKHQVMLGVDIMKDFGTSAISPSISGTNQTETDSKLDNVKLFREISLYYKMEKSFAKTDMSLVAGVFPRRFSEGSYSQAFISDSLRFYDSNFEGLLMKFRRPRSYYEVGCDWNGMYGQARREKFVIFASGEGVVVPFLKLGYAAYLYHFSCSELASGVVDNALAHFWAQCNLAPTVPLQTLSLSVGWLQSAQRDRKHVGEFVFPGGLQIDFDIRKWNVGVRNSFFYGTDMNPYYNHKDDTDNKLGNILYMGSPFYRVHDDGNTKWGYYDRLEAYYEPTFGKYLKIRVAAIFHFNGKFSGCQQVVTLSFNLEELLDRKKH